MAAKLLKSTLIVSSMTILSRILGFARDMVLAITFGATASQDAFLVAFKIPNFMRRLFAEGAFSQAFVPTLSDYKADDQKDEVRAFVQATFGVLGVVLFLVTLAGIILAPFLITIFAPGFGDEPEQFAKASQMLKITFPYLFFISLTAFFGAIQNSYDKFAMPALTPVILNISLIAAALCLTNAVAYPAQALAYGVLVAGILQFLFQLPFVARLGFLAWPKINFSHPGVKKIFKLIVPAIIGASVMQINLLVDTIFASFLPAGSITWLYYSDRLLEFPIGVFGVAIATVSLPHLSAQYSKQSTQNFSYSLDWALRWVILVGLPASVGLIVMSGPILTTLFQYHKFSPHDVFMAKLSLINLAAGLLFFLAVKVLVGAFFARKDTTLPMKVAFFALITNIILNTILIGPLQHAGLALASSISALLQSIILLFILLKKHIYIPNNGWQGFLLRVLLATLFMCYFLLYSVPDLSQWVDWDIKTRFWHLAGYIMSGGACFGGMLLVLGLRFNHLQLQKEV